MTIGARPSVPLLTFHPDRLDRVPISYVSDGNPLAGHWLGCDQPGGRHLGPHRLG